MDRWLTADPPLADKKGTPVVPWQAMNGLGDRGMAVLILQKMIIICG